MVSAPVHGPLEGVRVLDLSRILAGPTCTQLLGDYGADILKIERPGAGDDTRQWGPPYVTGRDGGPTGESAYYLAANRNKRSVAVDMATDEGAQVIRDLARHSDVLVENFKVGGLKKYGLDYESLSRINPRLVYCSITGFGQTGPNAHLPGYDIMAQGYGGIMSLTGSPEGEPVKVGVGIADVMCGMYACTAILAALHHQKRTGTGQHIDIGLVDTQIAWLVNEGTNYLTSGKAPERRGNQHPNIAPYQAFEAKDGHLIVAVGNDSQFGRFCNILDHPALAQDERFATNMARLAHRDTLIETLGPLIRQRTKAALLAAMQAQGVPGGPINTLPEVFASDQAEARGMKVSVPHSQSATGTVDLIGNPVKFSETPVTYRMGPPVCGEHTAEVLGWLRGQPQPG
uniref:CaiB/BaiF CoA transferase family protein n=1 Tax=Leisingera sp. ANG-M1 TaxID=1577895 RepID=UPI000B27F267|nr:CaiB/BaiF CoA-transferase family protein [Leisingera sp. ANG-M1]